MRILKSSLCALLFGGVAIAQPAPAPPGSPPRRPSLPQGREDALDPSPIDPATDPKIDMFIGDYRKARPRTLYGNLVFRDILSPLEGPDALHPTRPGATLREIGAISYVTLRPGGNAAGRLAAGERQGYLTTAGTGRITVDGKTHELREGSYFTLRPNYDFTMVSTGKEPLAFYVRSDGKLPDPRPNDPFTVGNRYDEDRRLGIHWVHIRSGGPQGMGMITLAPNTIPHPHSHHNEEMWIQVKGTTILSIGKELRVMTPGQGIRIPPTGLTAHSSINMGDEPAQMLVSIANGGGSEYDYAQLDDEAIDVKSGPDIDMYMGNWKDAPPRIMHGNMYFRDMLTALEGADALRPARKGAVLVNATAVSYAMLEPGATAHPLPNELNGIQQAFVVNGGTGTMSSGGIETPLKKGMSFIIPPNVEFRLKATGERYMTFYVVSERIPRGATAAGAVRVVDNAAAAPVPHAWVDRDRTLIRQSDGLLQYRSINAAEMGSMTMSRPYSVPHGSEEIWIATDNDIDMLFGKRLRKLPAGTAYSIPATGTLAQARIDLTDRPASFLHFSK